MKKSKKWLVIYYVDGVQVDDTEVNGDNAKEAMNVAIDLFRNDFKGGKQLVKSKKGNHTIQVEIDCRGVETY